MSNLQSNRIDAVLSAQQLQAILTHIAAIEPMLGFSPAGLTDTERIRLPKINVSNKAFVEDALVAVKQHASELPPYFSTVALENDLNLFNALESIQSALKDILRRIEDSRILAGSEAYTSSLAVYKLLQVADEAGRPGLKESVKNLRTRFKNVSVSEEPPAEETV